MMQFSSLLETLNPPEWLTGRTQRQALRNVDCYLDVDGTPTKIRSHRMAEGADSPEPMPELLQELLRATAGVHMSEFGIDLDEHLDDETATLLWERVGERARQAVDMGLLPDFEDHGELDAWSTFRMIATVLAEGMQYSSLPV